MGYVQLLLGKHLLIGVLLHITGQVDSSSCHLNI
jgi:hypothetical protein